MTAEEARNLTPMTVLESDYFGTMQVLKKIRYGYLMFVYEDAHNVYAVQHVSFEDVEKHCELSQDPYDLFDSELIEHTDDIGGFCHRTDYEY